MNENENVRDELRTTPAADEVGDTDLAQTPTAPAPDEQGTAEPISEENGTPGSADGEKAASPEAPAKKVYVNAPPKKKEKDEDRVRWGW